MQVDIAGGNVVASTIIADSATRLGLATGKEVMVVIKARDVVLGVDE